MLNNTYQERLNAARIALESEMQADAIAAGYPDDVQVADAFTTLRCIVTRGEAEIAIEARSEASMSDAIRTNDTNPLTASSLWLSAYSVESGDFFNLREMGFTAPAGSAAFHFSGVVIADAARAPRVFTMLRDFVRANFAEFIEV